MPLTAAVTGATGFLGRRLCAALVADGWDVVGLARGDAPIEGVTRVVGDVADEATRTALFNHRPDVLYHLAWIATPGLYLGSRANLAHLYATVDLLEAAGRRCRAVVQTGTCFEYASPLAPVTEDAPLAARHLYTACKLAQAEAGRRLCELGGARHTWARVFFPVGPGAHPGRLFPQLRAALASGATYAMRSDGSHVRDFIHVDDVASALLACARDDAPPVVNVGSGQGRTLRDAVLTVARRMGAEDRVSFGVADLHEPQVLVADVTRLRALGWAPRADALEDE